MLLQVPYWVPRTPYTVAQLSYVAAASAACPGAGIKPDAGCSQATPSLVPGREGYVDVWPRHQPRSQAGEEAAQVLQLLLGNGAPHHNLQQ